MKKILFILFIAVFLISGSLALAWSDQGSSEMKKTAWENLVFDVVGHYPISKEDYFTAPNGKATNLAMTKNWLFDVAMRRYIESHTSYQFGNPDGARQTPLSRLEWPLNTWWMDLELRRTCPRWSVGGRFSFNVANDVVGKMEDSDWENPANTKMLTTYSETYARMGRNFMIRADVDVNISDWLRLPKGMEIRPIFAFQYQHFSLYDLNGTQSSVGNYDNPEHDASDGSNVSSLDGTYINFKQDYYMYMIGLRGSYDLLKPDKNIQIKLHGETTWGPVLGYNEDHHLKREGNMFVREKTAGNALYFLFGADAVLWKRLTVGFTMDYLWIRTIGVHKWINQPLGVDQCWRDDVKVWSDQTSLIGHVSYAF